MTALVPQMNSLPDLPRHGGDIAAAEARWGRPKRPWLDLSTGINPRPYPVPPLPPATWTHAWTRLPGTAEEAEFVGAARGYLGAGGHAATSLGIVPVPGTDLLIHLLPRLQPAARVGVLSPGYGDYANAFAAAGHAVIPLSAAALAEPGTVARHGLRTLILGRPNNPDGLILPWSLIASLACDLQAAAGLLIIDEAFCDLCPEHSLAAAAPALGAPPLGVIVLRSFGKFFGLAGLRLGFVVTTHERAARLRAALGAWPVSGIALAVGAAALADRAWQAGARAQLAYTRRQLDAVLVAGGCSLAGGTDLFRLVRHERAPALWEHLGRAGILTRAFANLPGHLRVGPPADALALDRLADALAAFR